MMKYAVFAFILLKIANAITVDDCPLNLDRSRYLQVHNNKCYYFYLHQLLDYSDAEDICFTEGGYLAMIKSDDVNLFIHSQLAYTYSKLKGHMRVWIGLNDLEKEGTFKWADGSPLHYENFGTLEGPHALFIHAARYIEDCVAMDQTTGKWFDYKCESGFLIFDEHRPFICEFEPEVHTTTTSAPTTTTPLIIIDTNVTISTNMTMP